MSKEEEERERERTRSRRKIVIMKKLGGRGWAVGKNKEDL
jgi:hypothetical protein